MGAGPSVSPSVNFGMIWLLAELIHPLFNIIRTVAEMRFAMVSGLTT